MMRGLTLRLFGNPEAATPLLLEAKKQLTARLEEKPENFELMSALCETNGALGETGHSITSCEAALAAMPGDAFLAPVQWITLASGLAMGGAPDRAMRVLWSLSESPVVPSTKELLVDPRLDDLKELDEWQRLITALDARS